jgi:hypothetical protein
MSFEFVKKTPILLVSGLSIVVIILLIDGMTSPDWEINENSSYGVFGYCREERKEEIHQGGSSTWSYCKACTSYGSTACGPRIDSNENIKVAQVFSALSVISMITILLLLCKTFCFSGFSKKILISCFIISIISFVAELTTIISWMSKMHTNVYGSSFFIYIGGIVCNAVLVIDVLISYIIETSNTNRFNEQQQNYLSLV